MLVHYLVKKGMTIRQVLPHTLFNHVWSLGGVESWGYSGSPKLASLVVLGLFVEKHKYTEK